MFGGSTYIVNFDNHYQFDMISKPTYVKLLQIKHKKYTSVNGQLIYSKNVLQSWPPPNAKCVVQDQKDVITFTAKDISLTVRN